MDIEKLREKLKNHIVCIEFQSLNSGDMKSREYTLCEKYMNIPNHVARQTGDKLLCYDVERARGTRSCRTYLTNLRIYNT